MEMQQEIEKMENELMKTYPLPLKLFIKMRQKTKEYAKREGLSESEEERLYFGELRLLDIYSGEVKLK